MPFVLFQNYTNGGGGLLFSPKCNLRFSSLNFKKGFFSLTEVGFGLGVGIGLELH